jgi:hypothetical protein
MASLYIRKCANFSPYMRRPLVIYDFTPDPSEFPYIRGKFYFIFYQCRVGAGRDTEQTDQWEKFGGTFNSLDYDNGMGV